MKPTAPLIGLFMLALCLGPEPRLAAQTQVPAMSYTSGALKRTAVLGLGERGVSPQAITSGHVDEALLNAQADSQSVPRPIVWTIAYMETRYGKQGNRALGPGKLDTIPSGDTLKIVRVCREIGRFQIRPCGGLAKMFGPRCSPARVRASYQDNIWCGVRYLRYLHDRYGSWGEAIPRYNGGSEAYRRKAYEYLGSIFLKEYQ